MWIKSFFLRVVLLSAFVLPACSATKHSVISDPRTKPPLNISAPESLELKRFKFIVVTPENVDEVFDQLEESKSELVLFAVTEDGYKSLASNVDDIKNYILLQQKTITLYKEYYENQQ